MHIPGLPIEISYLVFDYLRPPDIRKCALVNSEWLDMANEISHDDDSGPRDGKALYASVNAHNRMAIMPPPVDEESNFAQAPDITF